MAAHPISGGGGDFLAEAIAVIATGSLPLESSVFPLPLTHPWGGAVLAGGGGRWDARLRRHPVPRQEQHSLPGPL